MPRLPLPDPRRLPAHPPRRPAPAHRVAARSPAWARASRSARPLHGTPRARRHLPHPSHPASGHRQSLPARPATPGRHRRSPEPPAGRPTPAPRPPQRPSPRRGHRPAPAPASRRRRPPARRAPPPRRATRPAQGRPRESRDGGSANRARCFMVSDNARRGRASIPATGADKRPPSSGNRCRRKVRARQDTAVGNTHPSATGETGTRTRESATENKPPMAWASCLVWTSWVPRHSVARSRDGVACHPKALKLDRMPRLRQG